MRIVAWNCAKAFHNKIDRLLTLQPDVAVISECAAPEVLDRKCRLPEFSAPPIWHGDHPNWGVGVFFFNGWAGRRHQQFDHNLKLLLPVEVTKPRCFNLLAVWAFTYGLRKAQRGPLNEGAEFYRQFLTKEDAVLAGDLNHNVIWDKDGWAGNFRASLNTLDDYCLVSAYHAAKSEAQGKETTPTIYWKKRRKDGDTYHIDYIFVPCTWTKRTFNLQIGRYDDWVAPGTGMNGKGLSDHVPVILDTGDG
ncbi:MAG: hypothetical protein OYG32_17785 [Rhodospirillaceae bacterium]|nr:hypothetical protein [Rhodospirillaceae bacterium]